MELLLNEREECNRIEIYNEYLRKIPDLLKQLDAVEKMYQKALLEEEMLKEKDMDNHSVQLYADRLSRTKTQCEMRSADIRQQCRLIFELMRQIEAESSALKALMP
ncbi:MAG: hypothetical protein IJO55_11785 [Lachnospiraceae bacterium]|nr:hypothetical protein [Lachnospiraceae bacterium]